jgi:hypothetical protein
MVAGYRLPSRWQWLASVTSDMHLDLGLLFNVSQYVAGVVDSIATKNRVAEVPQSGSAPATCEQR